MWQRIWFIVLLISQLSACEYLALLTTPHKKPIPSHSKLATSAENLFWQTLHTGRYEAIDTALSLLTAAYLANPNDPKLAAHLGFLHLWKITERQRLASKKPLITNEIILARKFFADALLLDPKNPIYQGFFADSQLIEGKIFHDDQEQTKAYFALKKAIASWPEFNYFTAGYPMSVLPTHSKYFKEGLDWQWRTLDLCAGKPINRTNPDFKPYMGQYTKVGKKRACWNSWIAPHNFEGFFMNMGDMVVKSGDWKTGIVLYQNAKLSPDYHSWFLKDQLEQRILQAQANITNFQNSESSAHKSILFNSGYGCVACHQQAN